MAIKRTGLFPTESKEEDKKPDLYYERLKQQANLEKARALVRAAQEAELKQPRAPETIGLLLEAIKLGYQKAGDYLIEILFERAKVTKEMGLEALLIELELLHLNNPTAAFCLGQIYAGFKWLMAERDEESLLPSLPEEKNRTAKAIHYLKMAINLGNGDAQVFLLKALSHGETGCIPEDIDEWDKLVKGLADQGNQSAAHDYGCFLDYLWRNTDSETESSSPDPSLMEESLHYFLMAARGKNWTITHEAIVKICNHASFVLNEKGGSFPLAKLLDREAQAGNQFIALYLAFAYCPAEGLPALRPEASPPPELRTLIIETNKERTSLEKTREYLLIAGGGENLVAKKTARAFYESLEKLFPSLRMASPV